MSSNQWSGPTGQQGPGPQGYQQGYPQPGPGYGHPPYGPPQRNNTGLIVALVVVLVLVIGGGIALVVTQRGKTVTIDAQGQVQPQGQPGQPQGQPQGQEQQGQPPAQQQPQNQGGQAPAFPERVGDLEAQRETTDDFGRTVLYGTEDLSIAIGALYAEGFTKEQLQLGRDFRPVGSWECADGPTGSTCMKAAYSGFVMITSLRKSAAQDEVARFGDELLTVWK